MRGCAGRCAGRPGHARMSNAPPPEPRPEDLALDPEQACNLVSEHGGEIVIAPDGRIVFMNASEHLVELAHALDPENEDVKKRMAAIEKARAKRKAGEA